MNNPIEAVCVINQNNIEGTVIFKEELNTFGIIGFIITCTGVWLVNREVKKY